MPAKSFKKKFDDAKSLINDPKNQMIDTTGQFDALVSLINGSM